MGATEEYFWGMLQIWSIPFYTGILFLILSRNILVNIY